MRNRLLAATLLAAAACGGGSSSQPDAAGANPDAPPNTPDGPAAKVALTIHGKGAKLLAVREDGGAWQAQTVPADGLVHVEIANGPYEVAMVCDQPDFFDVGLMRLAPSDGVDVQAYCTPDATVEVTPPIDSITAVGPYVTRTGSPLKVVPGTYDVVSIDRSTTPPRMVIQRDVAISAATTLDLDFATGVAMRAITVTAPAEDPLAIDVSTSLTTAKGATVRLGIIDEKAWVAPASALVAGDVQRARVDVYPADPSGDRAASRVVGATDDSVAITLPADFTSAAATWNNGPSFTWQAPGTWQTVETYAGDADYLHLWDASVFEGWAAAKGVPTTIATPDLTSLPGWQASWTTPAATGLNWGVSLYAEDADHTRRLIGRYADFGGTQMRADSAAQRDAHLAALRARRGR
ncbi:MAG: hypothetical protein K8W52_36820 [Deltaproteobacteria bacterium]|nr:hypothetical protein [Deltaproteobacteria bacterium]